MKNAARSAAFTAAAGAVLCAIGLWLEPRTMLTAWLAVAVATVSIPIGALGVLLFGYLVPGRWANDLFFPLSRVALLLPIAGTLMLPVIMGLGVIYPWAQQPPESSFQSVYLTPWFFTLRTVGYFAILSAVALWAVRTHGRVARMTIAGSGGMIIYALVVSLAGVDWLESVEPHFHSSIYGLLFLVDVILAGIAFGMIAVLIGRHRAPTSVYGGIFLSVLLCWAYNHAMQYIIIWSGNLPEEMTWYTERVRGGWGIALWALYLLQFVVPFFMLLSERVRAGQQPLLWLAATTLALRCLETTVLVLPALPISPWLLVLDIPAAILLSAGLVAAVWLAPLEQAVRIAGVALKR
jgi:hypothetical protein